MLLPNCPSTEACVKMWYIHTMEYCSATERNKIVPFAERWMALETITQSEVSQKEKKQISYINTYMWKQMNLFAKQTQRHRCSEQRYRYQAEKKGFRTDWEIGIDIHYYV